MSGARKSCAQSTTSGWNGIQSNARGIITGGAKPHHRPQPRVPPNLGQLQHQIALEKAANAALAFRNEFDERSMSRAMRTEIGRMVERAKADQLNELNAKRERLRQFLSAEETAYAVEMDSMAATRKCLEEQQRIDAVMSLKQQRAEQQRQFVEQKSVQKMLCNSEAIRTALTHQQLVDSKRDQLQQMHDRAAQLAEERDHERLWTDVMRRKCAQLAEREHTERAAQQLSGACLQAVHRQQMAERAEQLRAERSADTAAAVQLKGYAGPAEADDEHTRCEKRLQHAADLRVQVAEQRAERQRLEAEARRLEETIVAACRSELAAETQRRCEDVRVRRDESERYRQYLREMREQQKCDDRQLDRLIDALNGKLLEAKWQERCAQSGQTKERTLAVKTAVREQLEQQQRIKRLECEQRLCEAMVERQLAERLAGEDREKVMARMLRNLELARELRRQAEEKKQKKDHAAKEEQELLAKEIADNEAHDRLVDKYVADTTLGQRPVHPNTCMLRKLSKLD